MAKLRQAVSKTTGYATGAEASARDRASRSTLLVVDDSSLAREVTSATLRSAGFEVLEATSGLDALGLAQGRPDLIILDVHLPDVNGLEVCRRLKADPETASIPILYLSGTYREVEDRIRGLDTGADGYLTKPVTADALVETVKELLSVRQAEASLGVSEVRRRAAEALLQVGRLLAESLDPKEVGQRIADYVRTLLRAEASTLYRLESDSGALVAVAASGYRPPSEASPTVLPRGTGVSGLAVLERGPVLTANALTDPRVALTPELRARTETAPYRAVLALPLLVQDRVIGALAVADRAGRVFEDSEIRLVRAFADQAALALDNAQLYADAERRRREAEALAELGGELARSLDPEQVASRIVQSVVNLFGAQSAGLYRLRPESEDLVALAYAGGRGPDFEPQLVFPRGIGVIGVAVRERGPIVTRDLLTDPRVALTPDLRARIERATYRAVVAVPLMVQDRVIGALSIADRAGRVFAAEDVRLVQSFADRAAMALENARLYGEAERRRREAEELAGVARGLTGSLDVTAVSERVVASVPQLFRVSYAVIRLVRDDGMLVAMAASGPRRDCSPPGHAIPAQAGLAGRAVGEARSVWSSDVLTEPGLEQSEDMRREAEAAGLRAMLVVPLRVKNQTTGVLAIADQAPRAFSGAEVALLETFADQAALALENARLHTETRERLRETETLLAVGRVLSLDLPTVEAMRQVARQLARVFEADMVGAYSLDTQQNALVPVAGYHVPKDLVSVFLKTPFPANQCGFAQEVWSTRKPVWSGDAMSDPRFDQALLAAIRPRTVLFVPTLVRQEIVGGLFLIWWAPRRAVTVAELRLLEGVATQVGLALEKADLTRQAQGRQAMQFAVTRVLAESASLAEAMPRVLQALCEEAGWDLGEVWQVEAGPDGHRLRWAAMWHAPVLDATIFETVSREATVNRGRGLPGRTWATGRAEWIVDAVAEDARLSRAAVAVQLGLRAAVAFPVRSGTEVTGVVVVFSRKLRPPDDDLLEVTNDLGAQIGQFAERKRAEEALRESEERLRSLSEATTEGIVVHEMGHILDANDAAARMLGYTVAELRGRTALECAAPESRELILGKIQSKAEAPYEAVGLRKDGSTFPIEVSGRSMPYQGRLARVAAIRDITARKQLEEQLRHAQKMDAIGRLAGGVAHDFNNLLTVIEGRSQLVLRGLAPDHPGRRDVDLIQQTAQRAAALTYRLLAFSRKQVLQTRVLDVNALVREMTTMLRRLIGEDIELVTALDPTPGRVGADPGQLEQVILNLAVNARDAMPRGGRLTLAVANVELEEGFVSRHPGSHRGSHVMLTVRDTGLGMSADIQKHLFEPFFTTKEPGKGTGLGLAMVYGIVKQHQGYIGIESAPGQGTTCSIYLPRVDGVAGAPEAGLVLEPGRGRETVLLVEDEDHLRELVREILEAQGYRVLEARLPGEALLIAGRDPEAIDLLLTDVVMPQMSGRELAERLAARRPDLRVLYMSGYTSDAIGHHGVLDSGVAFLQKPFQPDVLAHRVREVLDARTA